MNGGSKYVINCRAESRSAKIGKLYSERGVSNIWKWHYRSEPIRSLEGK